MVSIFRMFWLFMQTTTPYFTATFRNSRSEIYREIETSTLKSKKVKSFSALFDKKSIKMLRDRCIHSCKMHSSRMRTARLLTVSRSIPCIPIPLTPAGCRPLWMQTPSLPLDANPPGHVTCVACWEATLTPVDRRNDTHL